jgi:hypothetical protein
VFSFIAVFVLFATIYTALSLTPVDYFSSKKSTSDPDGILSAPLLDVSDKRGASNVSLNDDIEVRVI